MNSVLQAVLDDLKREEENERSACCGGGRLPECPRPEVPCTGSESQREDEGDREQPQNYDLQGNGQHYQTQGIECIDAIRAATDGRDGYEGYLVGQCIKYLWRYGRKSPVGRELDLRKCRWYLEKLIEAVQ